MTNTEKKESVSVSETRKNRFGTRNTRKRYPSGFDPCSGYKDTDSVNNHNKKRRISLRNRFCYRTWNAGKVMQR